MILGAFEKFRKTSISFVLSVCLSVCPHGKISAPTKQTVLAFDIGISFENLSRISGLNKIRQELWVLYMKANVHL